MNVAVLGLWHLGSVTAACLAAAGHRVRAWDPDLAVVNQMATGAPPVKEPGLAELIQAGLATGRLHATAEISDALTDAAIAWVTFDTPVDEDDHADVEFVIRQVEQALPFMQASTTIVVSSQLPVGSCRRVEELVSARYPDRQLSVACIPENLRLGRAIAVFTKPDRVVVGVRADRDRARIGELFAPITDRLEWMSVESAEMTKHALNAFLASSVAFINEIAAIAERVGADARDVARGLKTETRIGPGAYLNPGGAFAGGTLARDIAFLRSLGETVGCTTGIIDGVQASNLEHRGWTRRRLVRELGTLAGRRVAIWGLTYKPGTDTLRRSESIEMCRWLVQARAQVTVNDPQASDLPSDLQRDVIRETDPVVAATDAEAVVVATEWPVYRDVDRDRLASVMARRLVIDPNRFLGQTLGADPRFTLVAVGQPST